MKRETENLFLIFLVIVASAMILMSLFLHGVEDENSMNFPKNFHTKFPHIPQNFPN